MGAGWPARRVPRAGDDPRVRPQVTIDACGSFALLYVPSTLDRNPMAKSRERIIRDPSGPATVSRETLREAAKQIWDEKRRTHDRAAGDGHYTRRDSDSGRFANAPALKPDRRK